MKKTFLIILFSLIVLTLGVYPFLLKNNGLEEEFVVNPAEFTFKETLHTIYSQTTEIEIKVNAQDVSKMELYLEDKLINTWGKPKGKIKYNLNPSIFGVGEYSLNLKVYYGADEEFIDNRVVEVKSNIVPEKKFAKVISVFPHDALSFTQGLEFHKGFLYEGTGQKGMSRLAKINLTSGEVLLETKLNEKYFGEGITILNDTIYQLTWLEQTCLVYSLDSLKEIKKFTYSGEGWGICNNGKLLIMSDGSHRLKFIDPKNFKEVRTMQVYSNQGKRNQLNELEYHDGKIYANVWQTNMVVVIDEVSGIVIEEIDGTELMQVGRNGGEVMNGIAYNPNDKHFYFTGKNWSKIMKAEITEFVNP